MIYFISLISIVFPVFFDDPSVTSIAIPKGSNRVLSFDNEGFVNSWEKHSGKSISKNRIQQNTFLSVDYSPKDVIASSGLDGKITLTNGSTFELIKYLSHEDDSLFTSLTFSPDGSTLASGQGSGRIAIWDVTRGLLIQSMKKGDEAIVSLKFTPDGSKLIAAYPYGSLYIFDVKDGKTLLILKDRNRIVKAISISTDGSILAVSGQSGYVNLYKVEDGSLLKSSRRKNIDNKEDPILDILFAQHEKSKFIFTLHSFGGICIWDSNSGNFIRKFAEENELSFSYIYVIDEALAIGYNDGTLETKNISTSEHMKFYKK